MFAPPQSTILDLTPLKLGAEISRESRARAWDRLQVASALQGIVNRDAPRLYVYLVGDSGKTDRYWLGRLEKTWLMEHPKSLSSLEEAISVFRSRIKGLVAWDEAVPATSNVAETVAGVKDLLPVRYDPSPGSLYSYLNSDSAGPRLPVVVRIPHFTGAGLIPGTDQKSSGSAKDDAYLWAASRYMAAQPGREGFMAYYPDAAWINQPKGVPLERTLLSNIDFAVSKRSFVFDLSPWDDEQPNDDSGQPLGSDARTLRTILGKWVSLNPGRMNHVIGFTPWDQKYTDFTGGKHGGVETEWRYADILSCFNAFMDADAPGLHAMGNASFFTHEPLKKAYPQTNLPTVEQLKQKGLIRPDGTVEPHAYAAIYAGDYDSAAWLYETMPTIWDDPNRGRVPVGWAFDPMLEDRFPTGLVYARETAGPNDTFISGDSGAGYLNPGDLDGKRSWSGLPSAVRTWASLSDALFKRWDLGITGFVIDGFASPMSEATKQAYAKFSPVGVVAQKVPPESLVDGTPFLRMGDDLPHDDLNQAAKILAGAASPSFRIYRAILWTPTDYLKLSELAQSLNPDLRIVDPYTLMLLLKQSLKSGHVTAERLEPSGAHRTRQTRSG